MSGVGCQNFLIFDDFDRQHQQKARLENYTISNIQTGDIYSQAPQKLSSQKM
ncbi:MAG: hypothetical protein WBA93_22865 [Microcoleaceae cyanobacterium]